MVAPPEQIEFHLVKSEYRLLTDEAQLVDHGVHIEIDWHAGRSSRTKMTISQAIFEFMKFYGFEEGLDITFRDSPAESFFIEERGKIVSVSKPKLAIDYWPR